MTSTPVTNGLTPDDAAELLRQDARARQRDSRARKAERAAAQERLIAEREAERLAVLAAKTERITELEARLGEAVERSRAAEERLGDAVTLLAVHHDVAGLRVRGAHPANCEIIERANFNALRRFEVVSMRYWTCPAHEAVLRAQALLQMVIDRRGTLPSTDGPVTIPRAVTPPGTPVTQTVRNTDRPLRIADRSHDLPSILTDEEAWIDAQDRTPYDPYEAHIAHIEALAEGGADDDLDDDGERF